MPKMIVFPWQSDYINLAIAYINMIKILSHAGEKHLSREIQYIQIKSFSDTVCTMLHNNETVFPANIDYNLIYDKAIWKNIEDYGKLVIFELEIKNKTKMTVKGRLPKLDIVDITTSEKDNFISVPSMNINFQRSANKVMQIVL